jgi:hypothetical protein
MVPQDQFVDRHVDAGKERNIKIGKFNFARKVSLQNLLRAIAHHRVNSGAQPEECKQGDNDDQSQSDGPFAQSALIAVSFMRHDGPNPFGPMQEG